MPDHDSPIVGLFLTADPVVKGVMILLLAASMACWAIILEKPMALARAFEAAIAGGGGLDTVFSGLPAAIAAAARYTTSFTVGWLRDELTVGVRAYAGLRAAF